MADMTTGVMNVADRKFVGRDRIPMDRVADELVGYSDYEFLDASSGDASVATVTAGRGIVADTGGIVKIDYLNRQGNTVTEVLTLVSGVIRQVRNVQKLYRYYVGTTAGTAKSYNSAGSEKTNAIKVVP